jgi:hypothetical protein
MNQEIILPCGTCTRREDGNPCTPVTKAIIEAVVQDDPMTDIPEGTPRGLTAKNLLKGFKSHRVAAEAARAACRLEIEHNTEPATV